MSFSTATDLMPHQRTAVAKLLPSRVGALFMDMGTGKSRTLLELSAIRQEKFDRLIWLCPVSLKDTVRREVIKHTTLGDAEIYMFDDRTTSRAMPVDRCVYIVGVESLSASDRVVLAYHELVTPRSFVAVDESGYIKGYRARRTQRVIHMSARARYRAVMNGTPYSQGAVDLYSQMSFLSPKILGYSSFWSFAANHLEYEQRRCSDGRKRSTGRILRAHNEDYLAAKISPYAYQVRKDECLTLPDKLHETRWCTMTATQRDHYEQAKDEFLMRHDPDSWSPIELFRLFGALQTICCGFVGVPDFQGDGARVLREIESRRLDLLLDTVAQVPDPEPIVIWAKYRFCVDQISNALAERYGAENVVRFTGALSDKGRVAAIARWNAGARFFVATQASGGHGLNDLVRACYVIFYADGFKYAERIQAEDRNHRIGQSRRPVYVTISCLDSIDVRIRAALDRKEGSLEHFQAMVGQYRGYGMKRKAVDLVRAL